MSAGCCLRGSQGSFITEPTRSALCFRVSSPELDSRHIFHRKTTVRSNMALLLYCAIYVILHASQWLKCKPDTSLIRVELESSVDILPLSRTFMGHTRGSEAGAERKSVQCAIVSIDGEYRQLIL